MRRGAPCEAGDSAAKKGDWDAAVTSLPAGPGRPVTRVDVKIALQRAMAAGSAVHIKRARDLEAQDQLAGAIAEPAGLGDGSDQHARDGEGQRARTAPARAGGGVAAAISAGPTARPGATELDDPPIDPRIKILN